MLNFRFIINFLGRLLMIESAFFLFPLLVSFIYKDGNSEVFFYSSIITFFAGLLIWYPARKFSEKIGNSEGFILVSLIWLLYSIFGSLPFILSGSVQSFTDAFFETISGFTTTGASVIQDVESLSKSILFWRSLTHFIGGMGILVLTIAILPLLGTGAIHLYTAETSGISMKKMRPRTKETARSLWAIYIGLIALQTVFLLAGGMNLFDSLCHSFGSVSTGGFSTRNDSIIGFSPYIQYVIATFMLLGGVNFTLYYFFITGKLKKVIENQELQFYLGVIFISVFIITLFLNFSDQISLEKAFRSAYFQVTTIVSCTGFISDDYMVWGNQLWVFIFLLMFTGGSAGSTSGGIKMVRHLIAFKSLRMMLHKLVHPIGWTYPVRLNKNVLSSDILVKVFTFFLLYFSTWAFGTIFLSLTGVDVISASGASAATLGGIGPGLGSVGPIGTYALLPDAGKWVLSFLMLVGRLELFAIFVLFTVGFWKNN